MWQIRGLDLTWSFWTQVWSDLLLVPSTMKVYKFTLKPMREVQVGFNVSSIFTSTSVTKIHRITCTPAFQQRPNIWGNPILTDILHFKLCRCIIAHRQLKVKEEKLTGAVLGLQCTPSSQQDPLQLLIVVWWRRHCLWLGGGSTEILLDRFNKKHMHTYRWCVQEQRSSKWVDLEEALEWMHNQQ